MPENRVSSNFVLQLVLSGLFVLGLLLLAAGGMYGAVTIGVPTPDPTPEVAIREGRDSAITSTLLGIGLGIGASSLAALVVVAFVFGDRRRHKTN